LCGSHDWKDTNQGTSILSHSFSSGRNNCDTDFEFFVREMLQ